MHTACRHRRLQHACHGWEANSELELERELERELAKSQGSTCMYFWMRVRATLPLIRLVIWLGNLRGQTCTVSCQAWNNASCLLNKIIKEPAWGNTWQTRH